MTLEDFYKEWEKVKVPKDMPWWERQDWLKEQRAQILARMDEKDRAIIIERDRQWADKQQSQVTDITLPPSE